MMGHPITLFSTATINDICIHRGTLRFTLITTGVIHAYTQRPNTLTLHSWLHRTAWLCQSRDTQGVTSDLPMDYWTKEQGGDWEDESNKKVDRMLLDVGRREVNEGFTIWVGLVVILLVTSINDAMSQYSQNLVSKETSPNGYHRGYSEMFVVGYSKPPPIAGSRQWTSLANLWSVISLKPFCLFWSS
jgi:hypothetical protein